MGVPIPPLAPRLVHLRDSPTRVEGKRDASGALRVPARIARSGVQAYQFADGSIKHFLRPESEVFSPKALASFEAVPVTLEHPESGEVTSATYRQLARGAVSSVHRDTADPEWVAATVAVVDDEAVAAVESGKVQLSCGYIALRTPCTPPMPYTDSSGNVWLVDAIIKDIRGNHVALTDAARAGPGARLILDSAPDLGIAVETSMPLDPKQPCTPSEKCEGCTETKTDSCAPKSEPEKKTDSAPAPVVTELDSLKEEHAKIVDALKGEREKLATELARVTAPAYLDSLVAERSAVVAVATERGVKSEGLSTEDIRRAVIAAAVPTLKLDSFASDAVVALFAALPAFVALRPETTTTVAPPTPGPVEAALAERARLGN